MQAVRARLQCSTFSRAMLACSVRVVPQPVFGTCLHAVLFGLMHVRSSNADDQKVCR